MTGGPSFSENAKTVITHKVQHGYTICVYEMFKLLDIFARSVSERMSVMCKVNLAEHA